MRNLRGLITYILKNPDDSARAVAKSRGCSPSTVSRYRERLLENPLSLDEVGMLSDTELDSQLNPRKPKETKIIPPDIKKAIAQIQRRRRRTRIHKDYVKEHGKENTVSYRTFCIMIQEELAPREPTMRLIHIAGEDMQVDFAGDVAPGRDPATGQEISLQIFAAALPCSQKKFYCTARAQTVADWIYVNEKALRFFGGAPKFIVSDNLKAAVTKRPRRGPAIINRSFQAFADFHNIAVRPARPGEPQDKAVVEQAVDHMQPELRARLEGKPLKTPEEIDAILLQLAKELNAEPFAHNSSESRQSRFEELDAPALQPLNPEPYVHYEYIDLRKVPRDYHLTVSGNHYSLPHILIGKSVMTRYSATTVEFVHDGKTIATHPRIRGENQTTSDVSHFPANHKIYTAIKRADIILWSKSFSENVQEIAVVDHELGLRGEAKRRHFDAVKDLVRQHGTARFELACATAVQVGRLDFEFVGNLLERNLEGSQPSREIGSIEKQAPTQNVRGAAYYAAEVQQ